MLKCEFYCTSESCVSLNVTNNYTGLRVPFIGISDNEFNDAIEAMQDAIDDSGCSKEEQECIECKYDLDKCYYDYVKYFLEKVFEYEADAESDKRILFGGATHHPDRMHEDKLYIYIHNESLNDFFRKGTKNYQAALYRKFGRYSGIKDLDRDKLLELTQDFFIQWYEQGGCYKLEPEWHNVPDSVQELYDYDGVEYTEEDEELNIKAKLKCH